MTTIAAPREQELAELVDQHRQALAKIEGEAAKLEADAASCALQLERLATDFTRPAEGIAEDRRALEASVAEYRASAEFLRRRAEAYATQNRVAELEAELAGLVEARRDAAAREEALARHEAALEEFEARMNQARDCAVAAELCFGRARTLALEIDAAVRRFDFAAPAGFDNRFADHVRAVNDRLAKYPKANNGYTTWPVAPLEDLPVTTGDRKKGGRSS